MDNNVQLVLTREGMEKVSYIMQNSRMKGEDDLYNAALTLLYFYVKENNKGNSLLLKTKAGGEQKISLNFSSICREA